MGKTRSRSKVFVEEKKDRKEKQVQNRITQLERENAKLRREIEALKASGKVPAVKKPKDTEIKETAEDKRKATLEKIRKWKEERFGKYEEE